MSTVVFLGTLTGLGLLLIVRGLTHRPVPLATVVSRLNRPPFVEATVVAVDEQVPLRLLGTRVFASLRSGITPTTARDLRILGRTIDRHVFDKLSCAMALLVVPLAFSRVIALAGVGFPGGMLAVVVGAVGGCVAGFLLPDVLLRGHAKTRRQSFEHALSSYVDLVNVLLAGGAGIETALEAAAEAGDGPTFTEIRSALVRARATRRSHWDVFAELGESLGIEPLVELASSMQLAGVQGARVRLSLAAKAASLRARQMANIEAEAQSASERMGMPVAAMFLGFLIFLVYPAIQQIAGT